MGHARGRLFSLIRLNEREAPGCTLHRSHPSDVARTEHLTFIASRTAGGRRAHQQLDGARGRARARRARCSTGAMKGRTHVRGALRDGPARLALQQGRASRSPTARTWSPTCGIMTRMGRPRSTSSAAATSSCPACTRRGDLSPDRRFIVALPGGAARSGASAPATAATPCSARSASRCASPARWRATRGWMAEHMLILELELPGGEIALRRRRPSRRPAARPTWRCWSRRSRRQGYKVRTVGDDIALAAPGRRRPAVGGQSRGRVLRRGARHGPDTNPNALATITPRHHLHERRGDARRRARGGKARTSTRRPTCSTGRAGPGTAREQGRASQLALHRAGAPVPDACRRAGRTRRACRCPRSSSAAGARCVAPLVFESRRLGRTACSWARRWARRRPPPPPARWAWCAAIPMAMLPFCGYNMGDYFAPLARAWARLLDEPAAHLPRELVPHRRRRPLPLARLRPEPARAAVDDRPRQGHGGARHGDADRRACRGAARARTSSGLDLLARRRRSSCSRVDRDECGRPRCPRSARVLRALHGDQAARSRSICGTSRWTRSAQLTAARLAAVTKL